MYNENQAAIQIFQQYALILISIEWNRVFNLLWIMPYVMSYAFDCKLSISGQWFEQSYSWMIHKITSQKRYSYADLNID